ncbi:MAG TPA: gliding motility-associated C-terminal domain-containing protein [Saprospiraceae bacterium]|nr:gliding motility-associated C-terminal domain-containing protein [Saprospiraceae bacterium]
MLKRITILFSLLLITTFAYSNIKVYGVAASANVGENVKVSFKVDGFNVVSGFQFVIKYDQDKLSYVRLEDLGALNLNVDANFTPIASEGKIRTQWDDPTLEGASLTNGTILFSVVFTGLCGSQSVVNLIKDGFVELLFIDPNGDVIPVTVDAAPVTVTGTPCGGAQNVMQIDKNIPALGNQQVCIPVKAGAGFSAVTGLKTEVVFPGSCGTLNEIKNITSALQGISASNFTIIGNKVTLDWSSASAGSLTAGSTIFEICFTPNEACCDQTQAITFQNSTFTLQGGQTNNLASEGSIKISCGGVKPCDVNGFAFIASDHTAPTGSEITMDVSVQDFSEIISMGFSMDWDPTCLELVSPSPIVIPTPNLVTGLSSGSFFSPQNGCMVVFWTDAALNGVTVPDATVIYSVKFKVLGTGGVCKVNFGNKCMTSSPEILKLDNTTVPLQFCSGDVTIGTAQFGIVDVNKSNASCNASCDGQIEISVTGATAPVIAWSNGAGNVKKLTGLCAGSYTVTVTEGANTTSKTYTITEPVAINISLVSLTPATSGNNGAIDINVSGGSNNFSYTWLTTPPTTTQDLTGIGVGTYTIVVTDVTSKCTATATFTITDGNTILSASIIADKHGNFDVSCFESCDGVLTALPVGGLTPYVIKWSRAAETTLQLTKVCKGNYTVSITDAAGKTVTASYDVTAPKAIIANYNISFPTDENTLDGSIKIVPSGGTGNYTFSWQGPNGLTSNSDALLAVGVGEYKVTVTDLNGCTAQFSKTLTPGGKDCFEGIGAITPNGDGKNDKLLITCLGSIQNKLLIFDRWGQKVYESSNYNNDWEGNDAGGNLLPDGGYYWVLQVRETGGTVQNYKGSVSIIRSLK